jgi:DNA-binding beta-propeller fold protein YncE
MLLGNHTGPASHAILSNVASGDVQFIDVASRKMVGCVGGAGNAHAALASPDNTMVVVADLANQKLHKIETDYRRNSYKLVETLSLGTDELRKAVGTADVKPVCHNFTADSRLLYVTLAGGGVLVVEAGTGDGGIPMKVLHAYPKATAPGIGCGAFRLPEERMVTNGESGAKGGDDFLFIFDTRDATSGKFPDPVKVELPGEDTHGSAYCVDPKGREYMLSVMRVSNDVNVVDLKTGKVVKTVSIARPFSPDPKPDVGELMGNRLFVALRGANPLTAINDLKNPARTPGVAVLTVGRNCQSIHWKASDLMPMKNNPASDPHGLNVFRLR